ncbi:LAMI_0C08768g1_1 [Lachancea mirantina]|uniref:LAMI_0C08768g1_1 n=1 Tax=Lachancea mirantina TaxID=1230905 RepID=A0A1G4J4Y9_9SACH|nr:LAMI_0C08768g1_1 [Lachancea mirantina]
MSRKLIIGGATIVAGYALYEYTLRKQQQRTGLAYPQSYDTRTFERKGEEAGAKIDDFRNKTQNQLSQWKSEADQKLTNALSEAERTKAEKTQWLGDQVQGVEDSIRSKRDRYLERSGELNAIVEEQKQENQPNKLVRIVRNAKDSISSDIHNIKQGVSEDASSIKDALVGTKRKSEDAVSDTTDRAKETVEQVKRKGGDAVSAASETTESIFNWGFNKAEKARAMAIEQYDKANKHYNELQEQYKSQKGLLSSGDQKLREQVEAAKDEVAKYKQQLQEASERYSKYASDDINELSNRLEAQDREIREKGFFNWLAGRDKDGVDQHNVDKIASKSVSGWGETAEALAKEELDEMVRNRQIGPSEAQKRLDDLKNIRKEGWFTYQGKNDEQLAKRAAKALEGWGETASEMAREEYEEIVQGRARPDVISDKVDKARQRLDEAKKQLDDSAGSWWSFGKEKKNELHEKAQEQYKQAEQDYQSTLNSVSEWSDKAKGKFWSNANSAIDSTKQGADTLHAKTKEGLNAAKDYVQDKK